MYSPLFVCLSVCVFVCRISHKVTDGFGRNLVDRLGVLRRRIACFEFGEDLDLLTILSEE